MKYPAKTDIAVLLLFFTRSDTFAQVFEAVRQARPSKLFLYQDGPRDERDMAGIEACRQIVSDEHIDWECEVHRRYLDHNEGCDPSGFRSHQWAFSMADKVIVLEDDVVPAQSFFPFCKEMLDRYEHDERISMIAGGIPLTVSCITLRPYGDWRPLPRKGSYVATCSRCSATTVRAGKSTSRPSTGPTCSSTTAWPSCPQETRSVISA